jgi:hypothetical protein
VIDLHKERLEDQIYELIPSVSHAVFIRLKVGKAQAGLLQKTNFDLLHASP